MNFKFVGPLDTFAVLAHLYKLQPHTWSGLQYRGEVGDKRLPSRSIPLRSHAKPTLENWLDDLPVHDTPHLEKWGSMQKLLQRARRMILADPLLSKALDNAAPVSRAMLTVLEKEGVVAWHCDDGPYHDRHLRFHVPLVTNPGCTMYSANEQVHMNVGDLWWFNNRVPHSAANWGAWPRIHLIFEMRRANGDADG
ncbi:aspartyl/asparaginyl beta-hydroxylase domain-containing protein [Acidocella sp.]|jgi:hypothetical protein|uniref:aspartyl/asparaginyl beta-hydroxylase domain-containing protein n=1 Tax=Acidocella sp. TaxID=50710 RepID=UPI002F3FBCCA